MESDKLETSSSLKVKMRTEEEIMDLLLAVATSDERIRAVYMNGSRTNPNVKKDKYQDYDIVYVVSEIAYFLNDKNWISVFGTPLIVQEPDHNDFGGESEHNFSRSYTWLMLFKDGNRIDLHIEIKDEMLKKYLTDKLTIPLLDKDNILPMIAKATDVDYHVKKPTLSQFSGRCNEFWWCLNNVAKGIARDELPYAMDMYNVYMRKMLENMLEWQIGIDTKFSVSVGKSCKYFKKFLSKRHYDMYSKTYCSGNYYDFWNAIFISCELFSEVAKSVGSYFDFEYRQWEEDGILEYLNNIKNDHYKI